MLEQAVFQTNELEFVELNVHILCVFLCIPAHVQLRMILSLLIRTLCKWCVLIATCNLMRWIALSSDNYIGHY